MPAAAQSAALGSLLMEASNHKRSRALRKYARRPHSALGPRDKDVSFSPFHLVGRVMSIYLIKSPALYEEAVLVEH